MTADEWPGRTVFVLAIFLGIAFIIGLVAVVFSPVPFHGATGRAISATFGAFVGIISTWLYVEHRKKSKNN
jgi:amino acid transporter